MRNRLLLMARKRLVPGASAIYLFNEGSGQVLTDYSGNGYNGILGSAIGDITNDPTWTGQGLSFSTDDYVALPGVNAALAGKTACTVFCVARATTLTVYAGLVGQTSGSQSDRTFVLLDAYSNGVTSDNISFGVGSGSASTLAIAPGRLTSTWECAIGRYIGGVSVECRKGAGAWAANTTSVPAAINPTPADTACIGRYHTYYLTGGIGAIVVYPFALTDAQVSQTYGALKALMATRGVVLP